MSEMIKTNTQLQVRQAGGSFSAEPGEKLKAQAQIKPIGQYLTEKDLQKLGEYNIKLSEDKLNLIFPDGKLLSTDSATKNVLILYRQEANRMLGFITKDEGIVIRFENKVSKENANSVYYYSDTTLEKDGSADKQEIIAVNVLGLNDKSSDFKSPDDPEAYRLPYRLGAIPISNKNAPEAFEAFKKIAASSYHVNVEGQRHGAGLFPADNSYLDGDAFVLTSKDDKEVLRAKNLNEVVKFSKSNLRK